MSNIFEFGTTNSYACPYNIVYSTDGLYISPCDEGNSAIVVKDKVLTKKFFNYLYEEMVKGTYYFVWNCVKCNKSYNGDSIEYKKLVSILKEAL
jgi:hypothetical protein